MPRSVLFVLLLIGASVARRHFLAIRPLAEPWSYPRSIGGVLGTVSVPAPRARRVVAAARRARLLIALGAVAALLVFVATARHGAGISPDSINYLGAAHELLTDGDLDALRLSTNVGGPFVLWPPLFPALIAVVGWGPGSLADAARTINAATYAAAVVLAGVWLRRAGVSRRWFALGSLATVLAYPLFSVSIWAWSEPTFSLWVLASGIALARYCETGERRTLLVAALLAAFAALTRYVGLPLIAFGALAILLGSRRPLRARLLAAAVFAVGAGLPIGLWVARNYAVSGTATGRRFPPSRPVIDNVGTAFATVGGWLLPAWVPPSAHAATAAFVMLAFAALAIRFAASARADRSRPRRAEGTVLLTLVVGYGASLLLSSSRTHVDPFETRILAPIAVPLLLLAVLVLDRLDRRLRTTPHARPARALLAAGFVLWLAVPATDIWRLTRQSRTVGAGGYATDRWIDSDLLATLRLGTPQGRLVSNHQGAIVLLAGRPAYGVPFRDRPDHMRSLAEAARAEPTYLVWFAGPLRRDRVTLEEIETAVALEVVATSGTDKVYRLTPR